MILEINSYQSLSTMVKNGTNLAEIMKGATWASTKRLKTEQVTKTDAVVSLIPKNYGDRVGVLVGLADYVEFLENRKVANIYIEGSCFCDVPVHIRVELWVRDAFNSAGRLIDCIRLVKMAKDRGVKGVS